MAPVLDVAPPSRVQVFLDLVCVPFPHDGDGLERDSPLNNKEARQRKRVSDPGKAPAEQVR